MAVGDNLGNIPSETQEPKKVNVATGELHAPETLEDEEEKTVSKSQYCVFKSGTEEYAIPIDVVKEVVKFSIPAPIPQMPNYILGMSNVRGNIYGVMDLETYFKGVSMGNDRSYLLVLDHETYEMAISIAEVPDSLVIEDDKVEQLNAASFKSVIGQKFLQGIIKQDNKMIILLNVLDMIASEDFTSFKD